jgi:hypothetical protein
MKLIKHFSQTSCYFVSLVSKHYPQHLILSSPVTAKETILRLTWKSTFYLSSYFRHDTSLRKAQKCAHFQKLRSDFPSLSFLSVQWVEDLRIRLILHILRYSHVNKFIRTQNYIKLLSQNTAHCKIIACHHIFLTLTLITNSDKYSKMMTSIPIH